MKYYEESKKPEQKIIDGTTIEVGMPLVDKNGNLIGKVKAIEEKGSLSIGPTFILRSFLSPIGYAFRMDLARSGPISQKMRSIQISGGQPIVKADLLNRSNFQDLS